MRTAGIVVLAAGVASLALPARPGAATPLEVPDDFGIVCVDLGSGAERWRTEVVDGWPPRLRIADGDLWEGRADQQAWTRRDLATGQALATDAPPEVEPIAVTGIDQRGFWTTTDAILHERDGEARTVLTTGAFVDDLVVAGDVLAFALDKDDGAVHGWSLATGKRRWTVRPRQLVDGFEVGDGSRIELVGERLLIHAPPALIAIDPATGGVDWVTRILALEGRWGAVRALAAGATWLVSVDGVVVAIDAATGRPRWTVDAGAGGATAPVASARTACFDRRDEATLPYARDEAEPARSLEVTVSAGRLTALRWVRRAALVGDAPRWPLIDLVAAPADPAAVLTLVAGDARLALDATRLAALDGTVILEVPGAWEDARLILGDDDLVATAE